MTTREGMRKYEFRMAYLDRLDLRTSGPAFDELNAFGAEGWHIVHVKEDPMRERSLAFFLEREVG